MLTPANRIWNPAATRFGVSDRCAHGKQLTFKTRQLLANTRQEPAASIHFTPEGGFAGVPVVFLKHRGTEITEPKEAE